MPDKSDEPVSPEAHEEAKSQKAPPGYEDKPEVRFLQGPQHRGFELRLAFQIFWEFIRGFRKLHFVGPCVTVFGSARFPENNSYYELARETGALLARAGFTV